MNKKLIHSNKNHISNTEIELPLSKSISNRLSMIYAVNNWPIDNIVFSNADDSVLLTKLLNDIRINEQKEFQEEAMILDCKNAGTVFRFLTAFLPTQKQIYFLTGSERMLKRPIANLVDSLVNMGADIQYQEEEGFPPLRISSAHWQYNEVNIDISESSQFASALLMVLPAVSNNTKVNLKGKLSSLPYIEMTLKLMSEYGIDYSFEGNSIQIRGEYQKPKKAIKIETDWSSASYWYELLALKGQGQILLKDLSLQSIQGDAALVNIFEKLGVKSYSHPKGVMIIAEGEAISEIKLDFNNIPDLAPAVIVSCAALGIKSNFIGLENLNLKESRRMDVLQSELHKLGFDLLRISNDEYSLNTKEISSNLDFTNIVIEPHNDHRMAMAFAPMAIIGKGISIECSEAVNKSYPFFWDEMEKVL
jgi:3-phosphoshikimate 1-carboxyvinyltransferase